MHRWTFDRPLRCHTKRSEKEKSQPGVYGRVKGNPCIPPLALERGNRIIRAGANLIPHRYILFYGPLLVPERLGRVSPCCLNRVKPYREHGNENDNGTRQDKDPPGHGYAVGEAF
jgi:hypothetical protein